MELKIKHIVGGALLITCIYAICRYAGKKSKSTISDIIPPAAAGIINPVNDNTATQSFDAVKNGGDTQEGAPVSVIADDATTDMAKTLYSVQNNARYDGIADAAKQFLSQNGYDMESLSGKLNKEIIDIAQSQGWQKM